MLFNSLEFIARFLPIALAGFYVLAAWRANAVPIAWLILASLFFYSWWDYHNLFVILPSITLNYLLGWAIGEANAAGRRRIARALTGLGVAANLAVIGYFKYFNFLTGTLSAAIGVDVAVREILLPLGISFFTFQQIKFLVDRYAGVAPQPDLLRYALVVSF